MPHLLNFQANISECMEDHAYPYVVRAAFRLTPHTPPPPPFGIGYESLWQAETPKWSKLDQAEYCLSRQTCSPERR